MSVEAVRVQTSHLCKQLFEREAHGRLASSRFEGEPAHSWKPLVGWGELVMLVSLRSGKAFHSCLTQLVRAPKEPQERMRSGEEAGDTPVRERHALALFPYSPCQHLISYWQGDKARKERLPDGDDLLVY